MNKYDWAKCIETDAYRGITVGKSYKVLDIENRPSSDLWWIKVKNDKNKKMKYFLTRFVVDIGKIRKEKLNKINANSR